MKKIIFPILLLLIPVFAQAAEIQKLSASGTTWDGAPIVYPAGEPEITAIKISLAPSEKMPFHCHPFLTVGYIISGTLIVEKPSGEKHEFHKGDTINEVVNAWHRGFNPSATENTELVGFYVGTKGKPTTTHYSEENKNACK